MAPPGEPLTVLFVCTGNAARSIMAEAILREVGQGRFRAFSAGSRPKGLVNPGALAQLRASGCDTRGLRSKSWNEFTGPAAPALDFVITVCGNAANETCPVWPGGPAHAHWDIPDPSAAEGDDAVTAMSQAYRQLHERIAALCADNRSGR